MANQDKKSSSPEGFDLNIGRQLGDGWIVKAEGTEVVGRLVGRFVGNQQDDDGVYQAYYQVKISKPVKASRKVPGSDDKEEVTLEPGSLLNIGEHKALEELSPYTRDGGIYDVWFKYGKQQKVPNTRRTFWTVEGPRLKVIKPRQHAPIAAEVKRGAGNTSAPDDEIPFE